MLYFGINCSLNYNQKIYNKAKAITKKSIYLTLDLYNNCISDKFRHIYRHLINDSMAKVYYILHITAQFLFPNNLCKVKKIY